MKLFSLLALVACLIPAHAQDNPPTEPVEEPADEIHSVERPSRLYGHIRLDGLWGIHVGGRNTGVELSIRQVNDRYHATFSKPPRKNPYGIKVGDEFLWATVKDFGGTGTLFVLNKPEEEGGPVRREKAPIQFRINDSAERISVQVNKEDMADAMRRFELVRVGRIESLRLYAKGPGSLQPVGSILEDQPMVIEIKHSNPRPAPIDVTITSGGESLTLIATALGEHSEEGARLGLLRTEPFYPTFGGQLGVEIPEKENEELKGREATEEDWKPYIGTWRTLYQDAVLGPVAGWIDIDEYGRAELRYRDPKLRDMAEMKLKSARVDGETKAQKADAENSSIPGQPKLILEFEGQGVVSEKVEKAIPEEKYRLILAPEKATPISIKADDFESEVDLTYRDVPDFEKVTLELISSLSNGSLVWDWYYKADRATSRDRVGLGRAGALIRAEGDKESTVGRAVGREVWMRQPPTIIAAYANENQGAVEKIFWDRPVYKNRYETKTLRSSGVEHELTKSGDSVRRVFIVARNLPPTTEKSPNPDLIVGEESGVTEYRIDGRAKENDPNSSTEMKQAWNEFREAQRRSQPTDSVSGKTLSTEELPSDPSVEALEAGAEEEGLLVVAMVKSGAEPGPQAFTLAGAKGEWNLLYGDLRGELKLARQLAKGTLARSDYSGDRGEWEVLAPAFIPEKIRIVVELEAASESISEIKAVLGRNEEIISSEPIDEGGTPKPFLLKPDPDDPKTYISPVIHLVQDGSENVTLGGGDIKLAVSTGDKLRANIQSDSGYLIRPTTVVADVYRTPSELNALWKDAVKKAADLAGQPIEDWEEVVRGTADSVTNFIFTEFVLDLPDAAQYLSVHSQFRALIDQAESFGVTVPYSDWLPENPSVAGMRTIKISVGEHAAMLLLRDEFVKMMGEQILDWEDTVSPANIRALYNSQKGLIAAKKSPLSFMRIPLRSLPVYREEPKSWFGTARVHLAERKLWWVAVEVGSPMLAQAISSLGGAEIGRDDDPYLYQLFDDGFLFYKTRVPTETAFFELFQWSAFNHAYRAWGPAMKASQVKARGIPDGDIRELLKLTGMGFEGVVKRVIPRMMKLEVDDELKQSKWVPDGLARMHVNALSVLGGAVRAQEDYSAVDTTVMMAAASVATAPLGGAGMWSSIIAASVSTVDLAYTVYTDVVGNQKRKEELEFEVGASKVLGLGRAAETESKIIGDLAQTFSVVGSGLGFVADTSAAFKAVKAMNNARLIEKGSELLKQIDFADPTALRALSKENKLILKEMLERSEKLAEAGRFGEIPEEFLTASKNRKSILKALDGSEQFTSEALDLARKREIIIAEGKTKPLRSVSGPELKSADVELETRIKRNKEVVSELESEATTIMERYPDQEVPPRGTEDAKRYSEISTEARSLRNQNGDFTQRRGVINSHRKARVDVPPRQAEILRGKAFEEGGIPPTPNEKLALRETRARMDGGVPPVSKKDWETVDLDAAGARMDEQIKLTKKTVDDLETAGETASPAYREASKKLEDLNEVRGSIDDFKKIKPKLEISENDLDLLTGKRSELNELDNAEAVEAIFDAEGDWDLLKKLADGTPEDQMRLHKVNQWRRENMDGILKESITEVEKMLGLEPGSIQPSAFGSTNLTSDYDISINPPKISGSGRGPELVVRRFQEKVRNLFGGRESGMVVDTNPYTDPAYSIFKGTELEGVFDKVDAKQVGAAREFLFGQMANVKYRKPGQWEALRKRMLDGVPQETRKAFSDILDQAEGANKLGSERINNRLRGMGIDPEEASNAQKLRVNNELYSDTLESLDGYKETIEGLRKALAGEIKPREVPLNGILEQTALRKSLAKAEELLKSSDPEVAKLGRDIMEDLRNRAILNIRNKQGEALYYASEAYQTEATINHVVNEMQKPPKKVVTTESIMSGKHTLEPPKFPLRPEDYVNSYFENGANLVKELNTKHVLDDLGRPLSGAKKLDAGATKASKYFVRQLDAASMAKLDMNSVKVPGFPEGFTLRDLTKATLELEENRGNMANFKGVLEDLNMTSEDYLTRIIDAQEELDKRLIGQSGLKDFVNDLRSAEKTAENRASRYFREQADAKRQTFRGYGLQHLAGGEESDNIREKFDTTVAGPLEELENALAAGRFLTAEQESKRAQLQTVADAQNALDQTITGARLSGVQPTDLDAILRDTSQDAADWRATASDRIRQATRKRLDQLAPAPTGPAAVSENTLTQLGIKLPEGNASAAQLIGAYHAEGNFAETRTGIDLEALANNQQAGRTVITRISRPGGGATWVRIHEVSESSIIADDPQSGRPVAYSPDVFEALAGETLIADPYRTADGVLAP